jgi:hypothetical protein
MGSVFHGAGKERFPVAEGEKKFLIVMAGIVASVNVNKSELAGVGALVEVVHGHGVTVIPAASGGTGSELEAAAAVRIDHRRTFFGGAVDARRNEHAVPMDELGSIGVVDDLDGHRLPFP